MILPAHTLSKTDAYRLLISLIVPRPIAWVGSVSPDGVENLAPFSFFMGVTSDPPSLALSIARTRTGARKHTALNILSTRVFTVSSVEATDLAAMHLSSAEWPGSEFEAVGVPSAPGVVVPAPRVARARAAMECRLWQHLDLGSADLLVGEVCAFHVDDQLYQDGRFDRDHFDVMARLGGDGYSTLGRFIDLPRPKLG